MKVREVKLFTSIFYFVISTSPKLTPIKKEYEMKLVRKHFLSEELHSKKTLSKIKKSEREILRFMFWNHASEEEASRKFKIPKDSIELLKIDSLLNMKIEYFLLAQYFINLSASSYVEFI